MKDQTDRITGLVRDLKTKGRKKMVSLALQGEATAAEAVKFSAVINQAVQQKKPVIIDPSEIVSADITAVQLLLSLANTARKNGNEISIKAVPNQHPLFIAASLAGLLPEKQDNAETWLGLPLYREEKN